MPDLETKNLRIRGARMSYIEVGRGDPILFLHGNPTFSYLWRNVIPHLKEQGRCIAPDLMGMGHSDKPRMPYRFEDHYGYLQAFIQELGLTRITLVLHDWGSALGFHYARENPGNIQGMAFMEALVRPWQWRQLKPLYRVGFRLLRCPLTGEWMIYGFNAFLNVIMPRLIIRKLKPSEKRNYKRPFRKWRHRKPMLIWPREIPINGKPARTYRVVSDYSEWLQQSSIPKLLLCANPGAIMDGPAVEWCRRHVANLETYHIGPGKHFLQEDHPHAIGSYLADWYNRRINPSPGKSP